MFKRKYIYYFILSWIYGLQVFASDNTEFRAVWVITWEHISPYKTVEQNKAKVRKILDDVKKANMNAVLWQARQSGTAYYNSSYEPWGYYAGYEYPGYDPLEYAIEEAHKRGLELHAWFNVFQTSSTIEGTIANEHPEWICTNEDGEFMTKHRSASPGLQAVRDYTLNVAMEIVNNYDIDGLHLDYIRWNEYDEDDMQKSVSKIEEISALDGIFSEEKLQRLGKTSGTKRYIYDVEHPASGGVPDGFSTWDDWRRWSVTEFVHALHDSIQKVKPWVRLSPAALGKYKKGGTGGWNGYYIVFQDAALWFNEGYIDQLTPMHYHWLTGSSMKNELLEDWEPYIQKGITAGRIYTNGPGSYRLDEENVWDNHPDIVNTVRTISWVDGFQFFSYQSWENYKYWATAGSTFFSNKTKVRAATFLHNDTPPMPAIRLDKIDSLHYKITVTPDVSLNQNNRFAIYRSTDDNYSRNIDPILCITFKDSAFSYIDALNGKQDFNGQYRYFATMLDRYWNESHISDVVLTDSIPSFAPVVEQTVPEANGEIAMNGSLKFTFSKTIDTSHTIDALEIDPPVQFDKPVWTNRNKTLTVSFKEYLLLGSSYTLTIKPTLKDINGRALDGNGDGNEGDSFVFPFKVMDEDNVPPRILAMFPGEKEAVLPFDIKNLFSVVFDEMVDNSTLNEETVALYNGSQLIPSKLIHRVHDGKSVVTMQPTDKLASETEYTFLIWNTISDTAGNVLENYKYTTFTTSPWNYSEIVLIDDFTSSGDWWQPNGSGSTVGIRVSETNWSYVSTMYLPNASTRKAARLNYFWEWDSTNPGYLIREYLPPTSSNNVEFDTTYTLQVYIYGDGSANTFRFCIDEYEGSGWKDHEVSKWVTIDWYGWRLVEWKLSDPNSVGSWISPNEELTGSKYRIDSFQFGHEDSVGAVKGTIYLDDFRLVKKTTELVGITESNPTTVYKFRLYQNFPNPFNPATTIQYEIPQTGKVKLTVYNILGEEVEVLVDRTLPAGKYKARFDGRRLASGTYVYRLQVNGKVFTKKMLLIK